MRKDNKTSPPNKLTDFEETRIIETCCNDRFIDMHPCQIVAILAEEGVYIGSERTIYRVLKRNKLLNHRERSRIPVKRAKPAELKSDGPNQVWSWDITYLCSDLKGKFYYLYMFLDVWSRVIVGWQIYEKESSEYSSELMRKISKKHDVEGIRLHSDNGAPMKGATMLGTLQTLGITPSFSRPRVSDDNPYSESLFKTLKYRITYPKNFKSIEDANKWVSEFVQWYNYEHRHSQIKYVTPMQRHTGEDKNILEKRKETYIKAKKRNPERWTKNIRNWEREDVVILNATKIQKSKRMIA